MRYCMNFYLNWCRNYAWSKLEVCFLLSKYRSSSFDHAQFLCHLRQKCIQYLILKLQSIVKKGGKGQRMFAFLCSKIALCSWDFQYIKWALLQQNLQALYLYQGCRNDFQMTGANLICFASNLANSCDFSNFPVKSQILSKIDGCNCTRCTHSNDSPELHQCRPGLLLRFDEFFYTLHFQFI